MDKLSWLVLGINLPLAVLNFAFPVNELSLGLGAFHLTLAWAIVFVDIYIKHKDG